MRRALAILAALAAASTAGTTYSAFSSSTSNAGDQVRAQRIFERERVVPSWDFTDFSTGVTSDLAFDDALYAETSNASAAFAADRWYDVELASHLPEGLTPTSIAAKVDFSDDNGDGKTTCLYLEARRASTDAVLATYGSPAAPLACQPLATALTVSQSLADVVTTTTDANDLKLRLYFRDEGNNKVRIHRVAVEATGYGKTWSLPPATTNDALDTTPTGVVPWSLARVDATAYRNAANFGAAYDANKSLAFRFPSTVPGAAAMGAASLDVVWKTANGVQHCALVQVWSGGNLIGTHGSAGSPAMCTTSAVTWATDTIALPEVTTPVRANDLTVKVFAWGGNKIDLDRVALRVAWSLGATGCVDPGTMTVTTTRDTHSEQSNAGNNYATSADLKVKTQGAAANKRTYLYFPLPGAADGCSLTGATLRAFQNGTQGTRTLDVYRADASWTETGLTWSNQPAPAGTPVSAANGATNTWVEWTVTPLVQAMYAGANDGFVIRDSVESAGTAAEQKFDSRESGGNTAQLVLTFG